MIIKLKDTLNIQIIYFVWINILFYMVYDKNNIIFAVTI